MNDQIDRRAVDRRQDTIHWPPPQKERHLQTIMQAMIILAIPALGGALWHGNNLMTRLDERSAMMAKEMSEMKRDVGNVKGELQEIGKKLVAVTTNEVLLRKTVEDHIRRHDQ